MKIKLEKKMNESIRVNKSSFHRHQNSLEPAPKEPDIRNSNFESNPNFADQELDVGKMRKFSHEKIKLKHFPMKISKVNNEYLAMMMKALGQSKRDEDSWGSERCRKRLKLNRMLREKAYKANVNSLVFHTNKEFHSSSFAQKIENLLTAKWHENPNMFIIKSKMTPGNHERVHRLMTDKFGRFK